MLTRIRKNIGAAIYGAGTVLELLCVIGYMIDTYQKYAASAMAAIIVLRSILAFALPSLSGNSPLPSLARSYFTLSH